MMDTVLSTIRFSQTADWNIKHFLNPAEIQTAFELRKIGEALTRCKRPVAVKDGEKYRRITIKINCGGVVVRDEADGERIKTKKQYSIKSGQLAVSKIDARNGAFGIVPPEADGAIITGNFWVYDVDPKVADIDYLILLLSSEVFVQAWQDCSNGSGNRLYLQERKFLNRKIPMPPIARQRELVDAYLASLRAAEHLEREARRREATLEQWVFNALGIVPKEHTVSDSLLHTVRFQNIRQWGYDKVAGGFPYTFEKYPAFSLASHPSWLKEIFRGKSPRYDPQGSGIILNQKCNRKNEIDLRHAKKVNEAWLSGIPHRFLTQKGDLLINSTGEGTLGRASMIVSGEQIGLAYDSHMLLLRLNENEVDPLLFVYLFNSPLGQHQVELYKSAQATKQTELGIENAKKLCFPLPALSVQRSISDRIRTELPRIAALREQAAASQRAARLEFEQAVFDTPA